MILRKKSKFSLDQSNALTYKKLETYMCTYLHGGGYAADVYIFGRVFVV